MAVVKISKSYNRKLGLEDVINRWHNIDCGTIVTLQLEVENEEELNKALRVLGKKVVKDTERELAETISLIKELSKDPKNEALVGKGDSVTKTSRESSIVDGMDDIIKKSGLIEADLNE